MPSTRQVPVNGTFVPYWQVSPAFAPSAGGFFSPWCGGLLGGAAPSFFIATVVGGAFAQLGDADQIYPDQAMCGGDFAGSDVGGGDFGGGDFGGRGQLLTLG